MRRQSFKANAIQNRFMVIHPGRRPNKDFPFGFKEFVLFHIIYSVDLYLI